MDVLHSLAHIAGRLLTPLRSGADHLAAHRLGVDGVPHFSVTSSAFSDGGRLPDACAGSDGRSPPLAFGDVPPETRELILLCEDPDAPLPRPFVHWVAVGIAPELGGLPEGLPPTATPLTSGVEQGRNTMHRAGYIGPTPPPGHGVHHYHFQLFALDRRVDVRAPIDRGRLLRAMDGHVIGFGEIVGTYEVA